MAVNRAITTSVIDKIALSMYNDCKAKAEQDLKNRVRQAEQENKRLTRENTKLKNTVKDLMYELDEWMNIYDWLMETIDDTLHTKKTLTKCRKKYKQWQKRR